MSDNGELHALARAAGLHVHWQDAHGRHQEVAPHVLREVLLRLGLEASDAGARRDSLQRLREDAAFCPPLLAGEAGEWLALPAAIGAHAAFRIELEHGGRQTGRTEAAGAGARLRMPQALGYHHLCIGDHEITLAAAPPRCASVAELTGVHARPWGLAVQLYSLRRHLAGMGEPGGVGDFTALRRLAAQAAEAGCDALAISPVHAMFCADPGKYSPYAPSSRLFLNAVYADPADVFARDAVAAALQRVQPCTSPAQMEAADLIDWPATATLRLGVLRLLHADLERHLSPAQRADYAAFCHAGGETLERHARFEALHAHHVARQAHDWRHWEAPLRDPASPAVEAFARVHAADVDFHRFLQWLARLGLARAHAGAREAGMRIGLMTDLAVGTDPCGSHAWSRQGDVVTGLSPGAPPDVYNPNGQAWGLTAFSPHALRRHGYAAYIEMLRAALADAGGLRIDHALGMQRMWLVPEGAPPGEGAYVDYPFDDMMRLTALESVRHRAVIMGENLGTVPPGFNERIAARGMLGMSVLWFEREGPAPQRFAPPGHWNPHHMGTTSTHDLPTVAGWWQGRDIDWRARLDLLGERSEAEERQTRAEDKAALWEALRAPHEPVAPPSEAPLAAAIAHVGRTPSPLVLLPLEDVLGVAEQPNLPGTIASHPNWRRRLPVPVEALGADPQAQAGLHALRLARHS